MRNRIAATIGALGLTLAAVAGVAAFASASPAAAYSHVHVVAAATCPAGLTAAQCAEWDMYHHA